MRKHLRGDVESSCSGACWCLYLPSHTKCAKGTGQCFPEFVMGWSALRLSGVSLSLRSVFFVPNSPCQWTVPSPPSSTASPSWTSTLSSHDPFRRSQRSYEPSGSHHEHSHGRPKSQSHCHNGHGPPSTSFMTIKTGVSISTLTKAGVAPATQCP